MKTWNWKKNLIFCLYNPCIQILYDTHKSSTYNFDHYCRHFMSVVQMPFIRINVHIFVVHLWISLVEIGRCWYLHFMVDRRWFRIKTNRIFLCYLRLRTRFSFFCVFVCSCVNFLSPHTGEIHLPRVFI